MSEDLVKSPRKLPKSSKGHAIFDSLLEGASRVLSGLGFDKTTTNRIAERAGVSIGSLYQYFPNKDAILAGLIDRELKKQLVVIRETLEAHKKDSAEAQIEIVISKVFELFLRDREALRQVFINANRLDRINQIFMTNQKVTELFLEFFTASEKKLYVRDVESAIIVMNNAFVGAMQYIFFCNVDDRGIEGIRRELVAMLQAYIAVPFSKVT
jgi:AcrR family transcriptional regulator